MKKILLLIALGLATSLGSANHYIFENGKKVESVIYAEGQADTTYVDGKIAFIVDTEKIQNKVDSINLYLDSHTRFYNAQQDFEEAMAELEYLKAMEKWNQ